MRFLKTWNQSLIKSSVFKSIEEKIKKAHEDIETVVSEAEVLIHSSNESDGIKEKELELKYDKLI